MFPPPNRPHVPTVNNYLGHLFASVVFIPAFKPRALNHSQTEETGFKWSYKQVCSNPRPLIKPQNYASLLTLMKCSFLFFSPSSVFPSRCTDLWKPPWLLIFPAFPGSSADLSLPVRHRSCNRHNSRTVRSAAASITSWLDCF